MHCEEGVCALERKSPEQSAKAEDPTNGMNPPAPMETRAKWRESNEFFV